MNKDRREDWTKNEFDIISGTIKDKPSLSHYDFLRIRNFKLQNYIITSKEQIEDITKEAFSYAKDGNIKKAINKLVELDGVKIPITSAILAMRFPDEFAIIDRRVIQELGKSEWLKKYTTDPSIYEQYLRLMKERKPDNLSLREFEWSLFLKNRQRSNKK